MHATPRGILIRLRVVGGVADNVRASLYCLLNLAILLDTKP